MIETRAVRTEELDAMLSLMCEAFGLPFVAARDLFYKDPYFDIEKKRVALVDGQLVSCLTIVEAPLWIGSAEVRVGGIAGVATLQAHRRKGYAARLIIDTLPVLRRIGCPLSALFPFSYGYYHKLGWDRVGTEYVSHVERASLPRFTEGRHVRHALPADRADMSELYDTVTRHQPGRWIRDSKRWEYLFDHAKSHVVYKRHRMDGYALFEARDEAEGRRQLRILEVFARSEEARRGLIGFFAQMSEIHLVSYTSTLMDSAASGLIGQTEVSGEGGPRVESQPGVMFRIVDFPAALAALAPNFQGWQGELTLVMSDSQTTHDIPRGARLAGDGGCITVTALNPSDPALSSRTRIEGDVHGWSQVLTGYYSVRDALSLGRLMSFSPKAAELAECLFPRREMFVPPADHF